MSATGYSTSHALTRKGWARLLLHETLKDAYIGRFIGEGSDSLIQIQTDLKKNKGDNVTFGLRMQLSGDGVQGDNTLEGSEEALVTYNDSLSINQLRHAVRSQGKMSEQRVLFDLRNEAKMGLKDWWAARLDTWFFNQVCGNIVQTDTRYTGHNAVTTTDASHILRAGGSTVTNDADIGITAAGQFNLGLVDYAVELAKTATPAIRPVVVDSEPFYVCFLHPHQVTSMRRSTDTNQWTDLQKAAMQGGMVSKNPIFTGALGVYNGVIFHETPRVSLGVSTAGAADTDVRRAVLCGAQSAMIGYGSEDGQDSMSWTEELFDYGNQLGVAAGQISGLKKSRFNSSDFASIVIATHAAAQGG